MLFNGVNKDWFCYVVFASNVICKGIGFLMVFEVFFRLVWVLGLDGGILGNSFFF